MRSVESRRAGDLTVRTLLNPRWSPVLQGHATAESSRHETMQVNQPLVSGNRRRPPSDYRSNVAATRRANRSSFSAMSLGRSPLANSVNTG